MAFEPLSKGDLLALWRSLFPGSYTVPIEEDAGGQGLDVFAQQAAQLARAAEGVAVTTQASYLKAHSTQVRPHAMGAVRASGTVQIARTAPVDGAVTLAQGTQIVARIQSLDGGLVDGPVFRLTEDLTLGVGVLGPLDVAVEAERVGYQGNQPAERITAFVTRGTANVRASVLGNVLTDDGAPDRFTQAQVGQYLRFTVGPNSGTVPRRILAVVQGVVSVATVDGAALVTEAGPITAPNVAVLEFEDLALTVAQEDATTGGRHGWLDAIGDDRRTGRAINEGDDSYRLRLCALEDVVSPGAIIRAAERVLDPLGLNFLLKETRDVNTLPGFVWDAPDGVTPLTAIPASIYSKLSALDNDGGVVTMFVPPVRFFVVCVGIGNQGEFGAPYDTPFPDNAWDNMFFDGFPIDYYAALGALFDAIERARAAGVDWELLRDPNL